MKKISLLVMLTAIAFLAGCQDAQKDAEIATCQQEKMDLQGQIAACQQGKLDLQGQLDQANATIQQKEQKVENLQEKNRELNQKALESIRTMMEKQNAKDIELKNKLKSKDAEIVALQQKVKELQNRLEPVNAPAETVDATSETTAD